MSRLCTRHGTISLTGNCWRCYQEGQIAARIDIAESHLQIEDTKVKTAWAAYVSARLQERNIPAKPSIIDPTELTLDAEVLWSLYADATKWRTNETS